MSGSLSPSNHDDSPSLSLRLALSLRTAVEERLPFFESSTWCFHVAKRSRIGESDKRPQPQGIRTSGRGLPWEGCSIQIGATTEHGSAVCLQLPLEAPDSALAASAIKGRPSPEHSPFNRTIAARAALPLPPVDTELFLVLALLSVGASVVPQGGSA